MQTVALNICSTLVATAGFALRLKLKERRMERTIPLWRLMLQDRRFHRTGQKMYLLRNCSDLKICRTFAAIACNVLGGRSALQSVLLLQEERPELIMGSLVLKVQGSVKC